jgi:effector-binding domain-containing protein
MIMLRPHFVLTTAVACVALLVASLAAAQEGAPAQGKAPSSAPQAQTPGPLAPVQPVEPVQTEQQAPSDAAFGVEINLTEKTIIYFKGTGNWDAAFDTIVDAFKTLNSYLAKRGIKPAGPPMTIYTATDDTSFSFNAAVPIAEEPKDPPKGDIAVGKSPSGRALKFTHHGSYDSMDSTYEAITNFLDERQLDAKDLFIEEYETDPVTTPEDKLVIEIYVPIN